MGLIPQRKVVPIHRRARHARHTPWRAAFDGLDQRMAELDRRMSAWEKRHKRFGTSVRMQAAAAFSLLVHVFVVFGLGFTMPKPVVNDQNQALEVVLVNAKSKTRPIKADAMAQHNLDGGGNTDAARRASTPLPALRDDAKTTDLALAKKRVQQLEREAKQLLTQSKTPAPSVNVDATPSPPQAEAKPALNAQDLMQRSLEIARLEARISRDMEAYQQRPRRKFIGARTQEFRFARYIEDWRVKIERVGELNYPQAARDQRAYGSLVVTVFIRSDGSMEKAEINRSSGVRILDDAAMRILELAAPYAAFPADISRDTDILAITRTWTFTRADRLQTE
jgi:protein TonB